jgi:hypothetical protein
MAKPLVLISSRSFSTGNVDLIKILNDSGCEIRKISSDHKIEEISSDLIDAVAWIAGVAPITDEMMAKAPNLKIISRYGVGVEAVDLASARKRGILVANTPGANSNSVAELTIGLIFSALRNLSIANSNVRSSNWSVIRGKEINGMIIGVIGYGKIGKLVASKLNKLGAKILVFDPFVSDPEIVDLELINKSAQLVTLHSPGEDLIIDQTSTDYVRFLKKPHQNYLMAFLMTRNEMDILPLWIDHHQDKFDLIFILDDFSEDGTTEFLKNLKSPNIVLVRRKNAEGYIQRELSTWIARHIAITFPQTTIMPLDTDEFIDADFDYKGLFLNCEKSFWVHKWANAIPINQSDRILTFDDLFFVEHRDSAETKVAFRAKLMLDGFDLIQGNHSLAHPGSTRRFLPKEICYLPDLVHIPVRCAEQMELKKVQGTKSYNKRKFRNSIEGFHWKQIPSNLKRFELYNLASQYLREEHSSVIKRRITRLGKPETKFNPMIRLRNFKELLH